jgi:hypothetical protein
MQMRETRLIDCTYLNAVGRCLRGQAVDVDDLTSLLRISAEILVADRILFCADPMGPVFKNAKLTAAQFSDALGSRSLLGHFQVDTIDYAKACNQAAVAVAEDLEHLGRSRVPTVTISPIFDDHATDPDGAFLFELREALNSKGPFSLDFILEPANAARFVLTRPAVVEQLRRSDLLNRFESGDEFLRLTAAIRSLVYREIATQLNATYLPATSRAKLFTVYDFDAYGLDGVMQLPDTPPDKALSLASAVDALVRTCSGDPQRMLRQAWELRNATLPLRDLIHQKTAGDALASYFKAGADTAGLSEQLESIVRGESGPLLAESLDIQFLLFAIPTVSINMGKVQQWAMRKRALRRLGQFANLLYKARQIRATTAYAALARRVGLKHERFTEPDASVNSRIARKR